MKTFKQFVTELFNKPAPFTHKDFGDGFHFYDFEHNGEKFSTTVDVSSNGKSAHVLFINGAGDTKQSGLHPRTAHKVFGTIGQIMKHHAANNPKLERFHFSGSGKEKSRTRLYSALTKRHGGVELTSPHGNTYEIPTKNLREQWHNSYKIQHGQARGLTNDIYKNPSKSELHQVSTKGSEKETGVFLHHKDMYAFDRYGSLHAEAKEHLNIEDHHKALPIYLIHRGRSAHVHVTDASRHTDWHHSPEVHDHIMNHPELKKHFDHITVGYYDEDIHGAWHDKDFNP